MIEIPVMVIGDHWANPTQVQQMLDNCHVSQALVFDLRAEGPSLDRLGILDIINQHCEKTGRSRDNIWIKSWSNNVESVPFKRADQHLVSHFFWLSDGYSRTAENPAADAKQFGFFVGRKTLSRMKIMKDLWDTMPEQCFFSLMKSRTGISQMSPGMDLESEWVDLSCRAGFQKWIKNPPISSVDDQWIHNQYQLGHNTNRDLLNHYPKFKIEIVAETYCLGECFFPTEKTVRPIVGGKPMLIYGPKHFLRRLRELGFRTWGDHWDESYDRLEGPDRWHAMFRVIKEISDEPNPDIVRHNHDNLSRLIQRYKPR
jgi:hypothetical protein